MTGNLKLLINFVWKFLGTVHFGNDHVASILGYADLQWGNILIARVYYVERLGHNLFSVGKYCDCKVKIYQDGINNGIRLVEETLNMKTLLYRRYHNIRKMESHSKLTLNRRGHFDRECKALRNKGNINRDAPRRIILVKTPANALVVQDGIGGYDWSFQAEEGITNFALMAYTSQGSSSSSSSDSEVHTCSKDCLKSYETLQKQYDLQRKALKKSNLEIIGYQIRLESLEARIVIHEKNEAVYEEDIAFLKYDVQVKDISIKDLKNQLEEALKEKDDLKLKLEKNEESLKNLTKLINSQTSAKDKAGLGYDSQINENEVVHSVFNSRECDVDDSLVNDRFKIGDGFHAIPPPYTGNYMPLRPDLSFAGLDDSVYKTKVSETIITASKTSKDNLEKPKTVRPSAPIIEDWDTDSDNDSVFRSKSDQTKPKFTKISFVKSDETSEILKTFIIVIKNLINHKVKIIRCDNGTEFKNNDMNQFCRMKGIKREFSVTRTPQQNGVSSKDVVADDASKKTNEEPVNKGERNGQEKEGDVGAEADLNNLETTMNVSLIPTTRIHKDHLKDQIIGDINSATQTRRMTNISEEHVMVNYIKKVTRALEQIPRLDERQCNMSCYSLDCKRFGDWFIYQKASMPLEQNRIEAIRDSPFDLEAFSDSDYTEASLDKKSTIGGCQFLGKRLISWQCKKQTIVVNSTTKAEYVAAANCYR
ncbi:ribonuclease H-like domain-containing protein [Tanacetum coccineum]